MPKELKQLFLVSVRFTAITAILFGLAYPLAVTALAHIAFPRQAAGSLLYDSRGEILGSSLLGQSFTGDGYFHSRPSAAGNGYDAANSGGSNLAPTNATLIARVNQSVAAEGGRDVPVDLVTASASGLDPDITPAAALFQVDRVARARHLSPEAVRTMVLAHTTPRQLGWLGEPRVNVLQLNLALDGIAR